MNDKGVTIRRQRATVPEQERVELGGGRHRRAIWQGGGPKFLGVGVLLLCALGPIQFGILDFGFWIYQPAIRHPDPEQLLEAARAAWPKALFDDELDTAQNQCQEALTLYQQSGDQAGQARALDELGLIALQRKRTAEALDRFDQALNAARAAGDRMREALILEHLGSAYAAAHQHSEALQAGQQALTVYRENKQPRGESRTLIFLGNLHQASGQAGPAIHSYQQAWVVASRIGDGNLIREALDNLAWAYKNSGNTQLALSLGTEALAAHRASKDRVGEGYMLATLGEVYRQASQLEQAIGLYQQALTLAQEMKAQALTWKLRTRLAQLYQTQGQVDQALSAYEAAVKILESTPAELMTDLFPQAIVIDAQEVFRDYADLLLRPDHTRAEAERAFAISEQERAHAFLDLLVKARAQLRQGPDPVMLERERSLVRALYDLQMTLQAPGLTEDARPRLARQWMQLQQDPEGFRRDIRHVQPRYAELRYPSLSTVKQIQQGLGPKTALLEYWLGRERSYLFVITSEAFTVHRLPAAKQIEHAVKDYRQWLTQSNGMHPDALALGQQLYEILIKPAREVIGGRDQLVVAPDGWLSYLPFEALVDSGQQTTDHGRPSPRANRGGNYLLEAYTISYTPSASLLMWLRQQSADQASGERLLLVYGDATAAPPSPADQDKALSLTHDHDKEARAVEQALGERFVDVRLRRGDQDPPLIPAELSRYRLLHVAAPSVMDEREPLRSGVRLALDKDGAKEFFVTLPAILHLPLGAELITLSHGQPFLNTLVSGRGIMSLVRGFLHAGTPAVVISLWDVDDASTDEFMKAFYQRLRAGQSKCAALREAKRQLRQHTPYQHPIYWARFVLIGDGEGAVNVSSTSQTVVLLSAALMMIVLMALGISLSRMKRQAGF